MAAKQLKNVATHKLTVAALAGDLTLTWDSVSGWPTVGDFMIRLDDPTLATTEIVRCTAVNVGALQTTVVRNQEGSGASAFPINSTGSNVLTAQTLTDAFGRIDAPYGAPATVGGRFIGQWTTAGAPASGTWVLNDFGFDTNQRLWICTVGGTPGTWTTTPGGRLAYVQVVANQGTFTALTDLTGLTFTYTQQTGRAIHIEVEVYFQSSVANDVAKVILFDSTAAAQIQECQIALPVANAQFKAACAVDVTPAAGARTWKLQAQRASGTGLITMVAGATLPAYIRAEDAGV